ncbi:peroxiredoxin [Streptomyces sp. NBC_01803]|uniref:peroxiredoxin n=1 Tax=Streptomyces sp. NBC_01803 TaxID=2975946 RepID=UPI002DDAF5FF|nr:peroxiredoxin [Streptomyces sp. NBC_01803]WSA43121.1 peroxiredoxin [Streptomyces sp. NBC_01803]
MSRSPEVGSQAPDFTVPGLVLSGDGEARRGDYTLSGPGHRGTPLVLVFYPGDDTPVCTKQLCAYTSELDRFKAVNATVWGISPQGLDSHERFARRHSLGFPLLADTDRAVARAYGVAVPGLGLRRSVFILDADGIVRWKHVAVLGLTFQAVDTLTEHLATVTTGGQARD